MSGSNSNYANGGDQTAVKKIADLHYGGYSGLLEAHGWERTSGPIMNDVSRGIVARYGSIERFENYHNSKPTKHLDTAHDVLNAYEGAWMKGFWGWSPESWGCVGYPTNGRRTTVLNNNLNTRLMFIYVTESSKTQGRTPEHLINRIVGFYELTEITGHRNKFLAEHHHNFEPKKWNFAIKAKRAFTIMDKPLPFTYDVEPSCREVGWGTTYGVNSDELSNTAYEFLKGYTYEEVPVFGSKAMGLSGLSFPNGFRPRDPSKNHNTKPHPVKGGAPNTSGYYVRPEGDSKKSLYILELCGNIDSYRNKNCDGQKIIKVGLSFSPDSRCDFFNRVLPNGQYEWTILKSTQIDMDEMYSCHAVAERGEWAMKEFFHRNPDNHLGGEFYIASEADIEEAWKIGRTAALKEESKKNG